jgi:hypothetical protein
MVEATLQPAFMGEWTFFNGTTPPPANAQLRLNNGGQNKATSIFVNNISFNGVDASAWLMEMTNGYVIRLQDKVDPTKWQNYAIVGPPVANSGYVELKTSWLTGGTNLAQQAVILSVVSSAIRPVGQSMTAQTGSTIVSLPKLIPISGGQLTAAIGTPALRFSQKFEVNGVEMEARSASVDITGHVLVNSAFPFDNPAGFSPGMTLRQYYASQAIIGFITSSPAANLIGGDLAAYCFKVADSMIRHEAKEATGQKFPPLVGSTVPTLPPSQVAPEPAATKQ